MTSRERVEAAFKHTEPDRTPLFEYVLLPPIAEEILKRPFVEYIGDRNRWIELASKQGWKQSVRGYVRDRLDLASILGHDMIYLSPNPLPGKSYFYDPLDMLGDRFAGELTGNPVERLTQRNERVAQLLVETSEESYFVYHFTKEEMERRGIDLPILAPAYFHGIWTDADLMQTMVLEPEIAREHFSLATKRAIKIIDHYITLGIDQIGIGGDFAGSRLLISPDTYRSFIVPEVQKLSRYIHGSCRFSINASDGNLWPVIDDFLFNCEVDGYLEIDMSADMDMSRLKAAYGDKITLFGNMDCGTVLSFASPEEIRKVTIDILKAGFGKGGHIFCANNAITASVPMKNYLTMVNAYREMFGLNKLEL